MFGKRHKKLVKEKVHPNVHIYTIPDIFYGGKDPQIYTTHTPQQTKKEDSSILIPKKKPPRTMVSPKSQQTHTGLFSHPWFIRGMVAIILIGIGIISWYYIAQYQKARDSLTHKTQPVQKDVSVQTSVTTTSVSIVTTTPVINTVVTTTPTSTLDAIDVFLEFPPLLTLDASDIDADKLTDVEEELFNTDSGTWDSDADGYYDGQEVFNLYNPRGFAPVKIIDSGLVKEYINPLIGYRVYYPVSWQQGSVDAQEKQVLFSSISGDYIEIRIIKKDTIDQTFISWFGRYAEGQRYTDIHSIINRFTFDGFVRKDDLVIYFQNEQYVVAMVYHPKDRGPISYRHVMQMMYQSFRMQQTDIELPEQAGVLGVVTSTLDVTTTISDTIEDDKEEESITTTTSDIVEPENNTLI